jgi:hypothetical protein
MTFTVEATTAGVRFAAAPETAALAAAGTLGSRAQIEGELDGIMVYVRDFWMMEPDQVMAHCASFTARLTELEILLHRVEARDREYKQIRTLQVQKLIEELERQFKIASRLVEVRRQDIETAKGF